LEISAELQTIDFQRERSHSLPNPDIPLTAGIPSPPLQECQPASPRKDSVAIEEQNAAEVLLFGQGGVEEVQHGRNYEDAIDRASSLKVMAGRKDTKWHGNGTNGKNHHGLDDQGDTALARQQDGGEPVKSEPAYKRMKVFSDRFKSLRGSGGRKTLQSSSNKSSPERDSSAEREYLLGTNSTSLRRRAHGVGGGGRTSVGGGSVGGGGGHESEEDSTGGSGDIDEEISESLLDAARRKSMPASHHFHRRREAGGSVIGATGTPGEGRSVGAGPNKESVVRVLSLRPELLLAHKPIITITSDSPEPSSVPSSPAMWSVGGGAGGGADGGGGRRRDSLTSVKSCRQLHAVGGPVADLKSVNGSATPSLPRSLTDSTINYSATDEVCVFSLIHSQCSGVGQDLFWGGFCGGCGAESAFEVHAIKWFLQGYSLDSWAGGE